MLKLAALAACTALVAAQKITNENGSLIMTTDDDGKVGYKVGSADPVFLNDMVTNDAASKGASYMHLGYQSAYTAEMKGIEAKIATAQAAHDAQLKANNAVQGEIDTMAADYKTKFGDAAKALKDKINVAANSAGSSNAFVAVAQKCQGTGADTCSTVGGQVLPLGVSGEVYANVRGLFKCKWDWKAGKQQPIITAGTGQAASATGAYSVVMCETPVFPQAFLTAVGKVSKNKMSTEITITQLGSDVKYAGKVGANVAEFQTINPEFIVDAASGFATKGSTDTTTLATGPTEVNQIMAHDPDSTSASLKFTFQGVDTTQIKKLEAVKISEADGKVHYSIRATGTGKKSSTTMTIKITVTDQNGGTAQQDFALKVLFIESVGEGGTKNVLTPVQTVAVWNKMGVTNPSQLVMCYNAKKHGYNSRTQYTRCANKGATFILARRSNGRVFGGFNDLGLNTNRYDWQRSKDGKAWVWNVKPSTKQIEFFLNDGSGGNDYKYYNNNGHHAYFGNCQALYCAGSLNYCRSYLGCSYATNGLDRRTALTGSERWYEKSSMFYEVYYVKK